MGAPTSPQRSHHPLPLGPASSTHPKSTAPESTHPKSTPKSYGQAKSSTPLRVSSALPNSAPTANSNPSYDDGSKQSASAPPAQPTQIQMDRFIESELYNAIFHDPKFVKTFLPGDADKLAQVRDRCRNLDSYYHSSGRWRFPSKVKDEKSLYDPVLHILNTIKDAVDAINPPTLTGPSPQNHERTISGNSDPSTDDDPSGNYVPEQPQFINTSTYPIRSDRLETNLIKPDLVLFDDVREAHRHWENVRLAIEVKKLEGHQKAAMKQLSRYARAMFAHQLHRRHLYAMMVCGAEVTFVRFDRAGILYSPRFDLRKDSEAFTNAFASLLMLDPIDQGYDPAFTCESNSNGRLDYYVDLPASAFVSQVPASESTTGGENKKTHRFKVVEKLCHRRSICGRATIVLRIRRVDGDEEYILKIMWRDPGRGQEGEVLRKVKGKFGLAQYVWHQDASGKCRCSRKATGPWECTQCVAKTADLEELEICDELTDVVIEVPPEDEGGRRETELRVIDTTTHSTKQKRPLRICVFMVVSSKGTSLEHAGTPRQFIQAVLDAILGYWGLFNLGILHRDISEGNVLLLPSGQHSSRDSDSASPVITDPVLIESEEELNKTLAELAGREATGMLSDYDLYCEHSVTPRNITADDSDPSSTTLSKDDVPVASSSVSTPPHAAGLKRRSREDSTEDTREPKKRKKSPQSADDPANAQPQPVYSPGRNLGDAGNQLIDFRTGTPAFMSIRVILVPAGERYHHSFLDDIESFFWLVLWFAAAHLDRGVHGPNHPTDAAQDMLDLLNQHHARGMANTKEAQLGACFNRNGNPMRKVLEQLGNSWASHRLFSEVIVNFGALVHEYHLAVDEKEVPSPVVVFPAVVRVFLNALSVDSD